VFAADIARIVDTRGIASLIVTADQGFARAAAKEVLTLEPATGVLKAASAWRRWFS
jgi:ABC-type sulfate/molybdate transport systems ATPase subunit